MPARLAAALLACLFVLGCQRCGAPPPKPRVAGNAIPRFDVHTHVAPGHLGEVMRLYESQNIVGLLNLSGGHGRMLDEQLAAARAFPGRVLVSTGIDAQGIFEPGWLERELAQLREAKAKGARGLKFHKSLGLGWGDSQGNRVQIDDPRLDPIFDEAGRLGLVVSIHSGDPKAFFRPPTPDNERYDELRANPGWSFYGDGFPTWEQLFSEYERRVARHPHTTFIGVHFGNDPEDPALVERMLDRYPNLYVDTAARIGEIGRQPPEALRGIFVRHPSRIMFGTDFSMSSGEMMLGAPDGTSKTEADFDVFFKAHWRFFETHDRKIAHPTPIQGRWTVDAIGLPREVLEDLYHRNAERLFGLAPLAERN